MNSPTWLCLMRVPLQSETMPKRCVHCRFLREPLTNYYAEPNHVTYVAYLMALHNLLPDSDKRRVPLLSKVFCKCCEDGQVSELTLCRLESALTPEQVRDVYRSTGFKGASLLPIGQVPSEWRQNMVEKKSSNKNQSQVLR
jgi:hypothetical protein